MSAYLIDASIYIFQAHFSPYVECADTDGNDLSAFYGFSQFLLQFLRRENPELVAVAMDESLFCGFRHQLCDSYKTNRELPDENLAAQLKACARFCELLGLACFGSRTYEADDIIGTLASRIRADADLADEPIQILTKDKDLAQLLKDDDDCLWDYHRNTRRNAAQIRLDFGIAPEQIPDYLGLVGDAVDRISGVPGLGPVKGRAMLQEYPDLDGIYANLHQVGSLSLRGASKLAELLGTHRELAYLSKRLATIVDDVADETEPFSMAPLQQLRRRPADLAGLSDFLLACKFTTGYCDSMVKAVQRLEPPGD